MLSSALISKIDSFFFLLDILSRRETKMMDTERELVFSCSLCDNAQN